MSCLVFSAKCFFDHFVENEDKKLFAIISAITAIIGLVIYIILMINFDFERFSLINTISLTILIICLTITRRWYTFLLVGFVPTVFVLYLVFTFIHNRESIKKLFVAEIKTALLAGAIVGTFLAPFLYHNAIAKNYSEEYAEWYYGGFPLEINHQIFLLGWIFIALLFVGLVYGLINKNYV